MKHFKAYALPFSDPDLIDEAKEAYGDWPWIEDPCDISPNGHHEFNCLGDPYYRDSGRPLFERKE